MVDIWYNYVIYTLPSITGQWLFFLSIVWSDCNLSAFLNVLQLCSCAAGRRKTRWEISKMTGRMSNLILTSPPVNEQVPSFLLLLLLPPPPPPSSNSANSSVLKVFEQSFQGRSQSVLLPPHPCSRCIKIWLLAVCDVTKGTDASCGGITGTLPASPPKK